MLGNIGQLGAISERGREAVYAFWEYAAFVANSLVFLLIGIREAHQNFLTGWPTIAAAILLVSFARAFCGRCILRLRSGIDLDTVAADFW